MSDVDIIKNADIEQKETTQKYFNLWYEEYKDFVNVKDLPDIKIEPFIDTESPRCYIDPKNYKIVHANQLNYYVLGEKSTKSIAFHEFTHVYDHYLLKKNSIVDKKNYALIYHEYHATILEMMCALQFRNITENPEINIYTSKVYLEREHKNLKQYLLDEKKNKIEKFEHLRYEIQIKSMQGGVENLQEQNELLQQEYGKLLQDEELKKYFDAEVKFNIMLADINKIIAESVRDVL